MKAEYIIETPVFAEFFGEIAKTWKPCSFHPGTVWAPIGTVNKLPDCWRLVQLGICRPLDDDCRIAAGMKDEQIVAARDYTQRLDAGKITGDEKYDAP